MAIPSAPPSPRGLQSQSETNLVGKWVLPTGSGEKTENGITFTQDKAYVAQIRGMDVKGSWTLQGHTVSLTPTTFSGKPIAERAAELRGKFRLLPPGVRKASEAMVKDLEAKRVLQLSEDGKTLSANEGSWTGMVLTKKQ